MIRTCADPCIPNLRSKARFVVTAFRRFWCAAWAVVLLAGPVPQAQADTSCRGGQSFETWLAEFRREADRHGISGPALAALDGIAYDARVLRQDRGQPTLSQSFLEFVGRVVSADRLQRGRAMLDRHAETFARIEREFGVQGPVIVALWGLETDYGAYRGDFSSLRALATLAYDCRRPEHFPRRTP
jgi:membrane-bound lytic murein transglycosylase B